MTLGVDAGCARCAVMLRMAHVWSKLLFSGTVALVACMVISTETAQAAGPPGVAPPPPAGAPGAKPSKDRFSKAMKRLREQRRNKSQREKSRAKAKAKRASTGHKDAPDEADAKQSKRTRHDDSKESHKPGHKIDLTVKPEPVRAAETPKAKERQPDKPKAHRPAPPLPAPVFTEVEQQLQRNLQLQVVDLGPDERWEVALINRGPSTVEVTADPRLLSFEAHVPGKAKPVSCKLPEALLPKAQHARHHKLSAGEQYTFTIDPLMYCFETGEQTILVPGTFLTPAYGFAEKTQARWSWGRRYEERLEQVSPFAATYPSLPPGPGPATGGATSVEEDEGDDEFPSEADATVSPQASTQPGPVESSPDDTESLSPSAHAANDDKGLKRVTGEGFALRSEYQGWARARVRHQRHTLGDTPQAGLKLSITTGSDAPSARDIAVTVRLENQSETARRVYFRRDLVSFLIKGPDGDHECDPFSAEFRAPDQQAFTTIGAGKSVSFTTQLLEFCPAESFARAGFYYVSAVLPATAPGADEDVFTGKLAASKPRPVRLHRAEFPFTIRRGPSGGGGAGGTQGAGRFSRSPNAMVPDGEMIQPLPAAPEPPPPPPMEAPPPPAQ
jgi:hypothetical protein